MAAYREILEEASLNNQIVRRNSKIDPEKTPVLLIHGFFSSQRSLSVMERQLVSQGFDVLSFNLGGMFGTFFTQGVAETANFIDYKLKRQMDRHGFKKVHIVAHSKGSLVAIWWLLKLGGSKYCDKLVAMAAPCNGSYFTYLALITPLGFFWRDVWQMRPGSSFLEHLKDSEVPSNLKIYSFYSENDFIARGSLGVFAPRSGRENVTSIAMNHLSHFDFVMRRDPIKQVIKILKGTQHLEQDQELDGSEVLARLNGDIDNAS
jgi:pimeloyl-ACP methyl ester carboxylesterase